MYNQKAEAVEYVEHVGTFKYIVHTHTMNKGLTNHKFKKNMFEFRR